MHIHTVVFSTSDIHVYLINLYYSVFLGFRAVDSKALMGMGLPLEDEADMRCINECV